MTDLQSLSHTELRTLIREAGMRATTARIAVLKCLFEAAGPLSHGEVCERMVESAYDRATLYRNLTDLTEAGLITRRDLGDHLWRFEIARGDEHDSSAHPHFVCRECGIVECLPEQSVDLPQLPPSVKNVDLEIQVRGVCNACD